jgi:hypothetical protein
VLSTPIVLPPLEPEAAAPARTSTPARALAAPTARLVGVVFRPEGEPASGARVLLGQQQAHCSADGRFELLLAPHGAGEDLLAFEPGHEPVLRANFTATQTPDEDAELRLVLGPPTHALHGTVVDRDGRPQKGWTVELDEPDPLADSGLRERVRTDAAGSFVITDVPEGIHVVRAWRERAEFAVRSTPIAAGERGLTIVVD